MAVGVVLSIGDVVEYLSSLWSAGSVGDVYECGVEYHLVEWDAAAYCCLCQEEGIGCGDVGGAGGSGEGGKAAR